MEKLVQEQNHRTEGRPPRRVKDKKIPSPCPSLRERPSRREPSQTLMKIHR